MAKIYPCVPPSSSSSSSYSNEKTTFTIWMKSLVLNSNGYTIYDSNGKVVFRIDNYDNKRSNEIYLMDLQGNILCTIRRKKTLKFGLWDCYKSDGSPRPWFKVSKIYNFLKKASAYDVLAESSYLMEDLTCKSEFKITDGQGRILAKVSTKIRVIKAQKTQSSSRVSLGADVLSLVVKSDVDHVFVMALVAIHGLIGHKI